MRASRYPPGRLRMHFNLHLPKREAAVRVTLNLPGRHNVLNALAAIAVAWQIGVPDDGDRARAGRLPRRRPALPPERRNAGWPAAARCWSRTTATIPRELAAMIAAARAAAGRSDVWCWCSSRTATPARRPARRLRRRAVARPTSLVLTEVYAAGEAPSQVPTARRWRVRSACAAASTRCWCTASQDLPAALPPLLRDGDLVLLLGAGDIGQVAHECAPGRRS